MRIPAATLPHEKYARPCARGPRTRLNLPVVCCARLIKSHSRPQLLYIQAYVYIYIYIYIAIGGVLQRTRTGCGWGCVGCGK
jgi:hypothetical protein